MRIHTATVGKGKAVHIYYSAFGRTDCAAGGMSDANATPVDGPVTCKRCLKTLAAKIEQAHEEANELNTLAAMISSTRRVVHTTDRQRVTTRKERAAFRRTQAAKRRQLGRTVRDQRRAAKTVAKGAATARTHLLAAGVDAADAKRFAGAFSRGLAPPDARLVEIKLKGRATATVPVKLYDLRTFAARLATYRPKDASAAARLNRAAVHFNASVQDATAASQRLARLLRAA